MHQKRIYVTKPFLPKIDDYIEYLRRIWETSILTNNAQLHCELEEKLKNFLKAENITLFVNGHLALETAFNMLPAESEVITTPFTFSSTVHAIVNRGLKPVFCDIKESDYTIDETKIEALINERTSAIAAVHVYGYPCNVSAIQKIADKYKIKVIYDAAHAFGVEYNNLPICNYGDISMFSFHATKLYHTIEGGALVYKDASYKVKYDLYKNFGISGPQSIDEIGINAKMNEFQAAMGLVNLKYIKDIIANRREIAERYYYNLKDVSGITLVNIPDYVKQNYAYLPVLIKEQLYGYTRDQLFNLLGANDIYPRKYFYPLVVDYKCYEGWFDEYLLPVSRYVSDRILTLPIYYGLSLDDVDQICNLIKNKR